VSNPTLFWRFYAAVYDLIWDSPLTAALADRAATTLHGTDKSVGALTIDLGCGTGLMAARLPGNLIGVDLTPGMLRRAQHTGRITQSLLAPAEETGLQAGCADAVLISNVLHLHPHPTAVVREGHRLCHTGTITYLWPLDELTTDDIRTADQETQRTGAATAMADILRRTISIIAGLTHPTRHTAATVEHAALNTCTCDITTDETLYNVQRLVSITRTPTKRCPLE